MERHILVIATYNRLEMLKECLEAVMHQTRPFDGIVIADNASTDGTDLYLYEWKSTAWESAFPEASCKILHAHSNSGGAGGFARGTAEAMELDADWITLIDDDAILEPDYLEEICKGIDASAGRFSVLAGVPLTNGIRPGHRRRVTGKVIKKEIPVSFKEYEKPYFICDIGSFCGFTVSADAVRKVGIPDERFFIWYDDTEYCLRLSAVSSIINWNKAVIQHKVPAGNSGAITTWKDYYGIRNRLYMAAKHYNRATALAIAAKKAETCFRDCLFCICNGNKKEAAYTVRLYQDAIRDGFRGKLGKNQRYLP